MAKLEHSKMPLYISAVLVLIGIIGHTVGAVVDAYDMAKYYEKYSLEYKIVYFAVDWLGRWIWDCFLNPLWCLPTAAFLFQIVWLVNYIVRRRSAKKYAEPEQQEKSERKSKKILFVISFTPIVLIAFYSVYCFFNGFDAGLLGSCTVYGAEALGSAFVWTCLEFTVIPVLPLMMIWQIFCIIGFIRKKNKNSEA
ncbi:MAG: hypothetical protein ACI4JA_03100 [Oscillospiraceae bacterium]